ncbi:unnamed protein product [Lepeophtheirus salmonis]|uniref:(salmon louse) hypothetical protein n=1 Tax=Lepeophtheirus salmonis TaxID=72036 RepID=A0A7R8H7L4_LEPSM|nr:unnamed protein product [Lepeophtheirus salmonis]CAF2925303.1 unnamed protein product [Lepeophtheirus salmonis]
MKAEALLQRGETEADSYCWLSLVYVISTLRNIQDLCFWVYHSFFGPYIYQQATTPLSTKDKEDLKKIKKDIYSSIGLSACTPAAIKYGACIGRNMDDIQHRVCQSEFLEFKKMHSDPTKKTALIVHAR